MNKTLVAVYGSLRQGLGNHGLLKGQQYLGTDTITGYRLHLYCSGFPCIVPDADYKGKVLVELYSVDDDCFQQLDWLEGYPSFYNRTQVETQYGTAWVYYMDDHDDTPCVYHGDWKHCYETGELV